MYLARVDVVDALVTGQLGDQGRGPLCEEGEAAERVLVRHLDAAVWRGSIASSWWRRARSRSTSLGPVQAARVGRVQGQAAPR